MPVTWKDNKPYGKCGNITWNCPYDPTDPRCCQYEDYIKDKKQMDDWAMLRDNKEALDKEYGREQAATSL